MNPRRIDGVMNYVVETLPGFFVTRTWEGFLEAENDIHRAMKFQSRDDAHHFMEGHPGPYTVRFARDLSGVN